MHVKNRLFHSLTMTTLALCLELSGCKSAPPAAPVDDASLTAAVQSRIASDGAISSEPIQSSVKDRVATLAGNISSEAARSLAASDAAQVAGIKTVVNNLTVQAPAPAIAAAVPPPIAPAPIAPPAPKPKPVASSKPKPVQIVRQAPPADITPTPPPPAEPPPAPAQELPPPPPTSARPHRPSVTSLFRLVQQFPPNYSNSRQRHHSARGDLLRHDRRGTLLRMAWL